ncbi:nitrite reductase small subunit NirD [Microbacterium halophytorum]|uniref:nitrite reductase small subunit NirD n=1 Tax=Microbacterium halophytorum TaxID=2067568 RepID=UPI000CFB4DBC|nr:nitrite reductase small subunit NirD [Microbacterium halophytorum]
MRREDRGWVRVCSLGDLTPERGRAALIGEEQIALFLLADGRVRATQNLDPYSGAQVLSRGIVGSSTFADGTETPTVISPLHKQAWDLVTGTVLRTQGGEERGIRVYPVSLDGEDVLVKAGAR